MNKKRLLKMADFVETLPPKEFMMGRWGTHRPDCGFVGCAMGHAAHAKLFRGLGLYEFPPFADGSKTITPDYLGKTGFRAAGCLFGIDESAAIFLFDPDKYESGDPRRGTVARRIRDFANGKVRP